MFHCPECRTDLKRTIHPEGILWSCPRECGQFVSLAVLRKAFLPQVAKNIWSTAHQPGLNRKRPCCTCRQPMLQLSVPSPKPHNPMLPYKATHTPAQHPSSNLLELELCQTCQFVWLAIEDYEHLPPLPPLPEEIALPQEARHAMALHQVELLQQKEDEGNTEYSSSKAFLSFFVPIEQDASSKGNPWATWLVIAITTLISVLAFGDLMNAVKHFGYIPDQTFRYGGLTILTSFFLHGGIGHLFGNMYFLLIFGDNVEHHIGPFRFLGLLLAGTLAGTLLHLTFGHHGHIPSIGASDGIAAVMAFYAFQFPGKRLYYYFVRFPAFLGFFLWFGLQLLVLPQQLAGVSQINVLAHLGGALAGFLLWLKWRTLSSPTDISAVSYAEQQHNLYRKLRRPSNVGLTPALSSATPTQPRKFDFPNHHK